MSHQRLFHVAIAIIIAMYILLSAHNLTVPGIYYDEVLQAPAAIHLIKGQVNADYNKFGSQQIGRWTFAQMNLEYIGAFKSYILAIVFSVFGVNVTAFRLTGIFIAVIGLIFTAYLAKEALGIQAALIGTLLVATDPIFILSARTDLGPVAVAFASRMASLFFLWRWWKSGGRPILFILTGALLGLGLYDKTNFLWFILALAVVVSAAWLISEQRPRFSFAQVAGALIAGIITSAPLWVYNAYYNWVTFRMISPPEGNVSLVKLIQLAPQRSAVLLSLLNGKAFDRMMFGQDLPTTWGISGTLLPVLFIVALIVLLYAGLFTRQRLLLFLPALMSLIMVQVYLTPRAGAVWHWFSIYPFPHLSIGLASSVILSGDYIRLKWRRGLIGIGALLLVIALCLNFMTIGGYYKLMRETGGVGLWSSSIYDLAETLKSQYPDRQIQLMDWGLGNTLFFLSSGQLHQHERYWPYVNSPQPTDDLIRLVSDPTNVFVVNAPSTSLFPIAREALNAAALKAGMEPRYDRQIYDRRSALVYSIIRFVKQSSK
jgi:4-amino-4-deoxy-L-arabinose transferase-like glycosyltransferase